MKKNLDTIYTSSKIRNTQLNDKLMYDKISNEQLDTLAAKAMFTVADEHRDDFRNSLTKIIDLFHKMSQVKVCDYKQYGQHTLKYENLREDHPQIGPSGNDLATSCAHYNSDTHYFGVHTVLEDDN